jgi:hypothetical protein
LQEKLHVVFRAQSFVAGFQNACARDAQHQSSR